MCPISTPLAWAPWSTLISGTVAPAIASPWSARAIECGRFLNWPGSTGSFASLTASPKLRPNPTDLTAPAQFPLEGRALMGRFSCRSSSLCLLFVTTSLSPLARAQHSPQTKSPEGRFSVLRELDNAMENLSELVGQSVVQIQVSAYGPREEEDFG